jgi:uncharacterized peroxidase-related enzyme
MNLFKKTLAVFALSLTLAHGATSTTSTGLLSYVTPAEATGQVKKIYDEIQSTWGFVPTLMQQYSLNPALLENQWELYKEMGKNPNFSQKLLAMMRLLVAEKNECNYCISMNKGMLLNMFKMSMDEIKLLQKDPNTASLPNKDKAMLLLMVKSANHPHAVSATDMDKLHDLGWSDKDIFEGIKASTSMVAATLMLDALKIQ